MWAKIKDNKVERIFTRPQWVEVDGVQYPPKVFRTARLASLGFLPIVTQQDTISDDESFYTQNVSYEVQITRVIKHISYTEKTTEEISDMVEVKKEQLFDDFMNEIEAVKKEKMREAAVAFEDSLPTTMKNEINATVAEFKTTLDGIQSNDRKVSEKLRAKFPVRSNSQGGRI